MTPPLRPEPRGTHLGGFRPGLLILASLLGNRFLFCKADSVSSSSSFLSLLVFRVAVGCRTQARHHMPSRRTTSPGPRHHSVDADFRLLAAAVNLARWLSTGCEEPPEDGRWHSRLAAPITLLNQPFDTYVAHLTPDLDTASGRCCLPPIRSPNTPCIVDESDHYDDLAGTAGPPDCADPSGA
jgi:hypothetical protein